MKGKEFHGNNTDFDPLQRGCSIVSRVALRQQNQWEEENKTEDTPRCITHKLRLPDIKLLHIVTLFFQAELSQLLQAGV